MKKIQPRYNITLVPKSTPVSRHGIGTRLGEYKGKLYTKEGYEEELKREASERKKACDDLKNGNFKLFFENEDGTRTEVDRDEDRELIDQWVNEAIEDMRKNHKKYMNEFIKELEEAAERARQKQQEELKEAAERTEKLKKIKRFDIS